MIGVAVLVLGAWVVVQAATVDSSDAFNRWVGWANILALPIAALGTAILLFDRVRARSDVTPAEEGASESGAAAAVIWRRLCRFLRSWHGAAVVVFVVRGVLVGLTLFPDDEASPGTLSLPARPPSTAPSSPAAHDSPCPTPTVEAQTRNSSRAHATFCADRFEFLLFDDSPDGKSAVLVVRVNGKEWPAWFNSKGHATRSPDGSQVTTKPPKPITVSFGSKDTADFRVCVIDRETERTYPEDTCGSWTPIWPRR